MGNLTPEYVYFVNSGGSLGFLIQEIIDRMQYSEGFMAQAQQLINSTDSPFETVYTEEGQVRRLKKQYCDKKSESPSGDNGDRSIQSI